MAQAEAKPIVFPVKSRYQPETAEPLVQAFQTFETSAKDSTDWLKDLRYGALAVLEQDGLPTPKLERWKYTNLHGAVKNLVAPPARADITVKGDKTYAHSLHEKLVGEVDWLQRTLCALPPAEERYGDMMLWHLGNLFLRDGVVIDVPAGVIVDEPVDITVTGHAGGFFVPRLVIRLGEGAEITVVERHLGEGAYWNNQITQIDVGANAKLKHYRLQENPQEAVYTQTTHTKIARDGNYEGFTLATGGACSRHQVHADLEGENIDCNIYGLNMMRGTQHADTTIEAEHHKPHCMSNQYVRTVLDDQANGVFQGKVYVHRGADKTDGYQMSNALQLADTTEMNTKPELEIYADDVKCSHGATTGQLDDEALFYLRSRGMDEAAARAVLIEAFLAEVVEDLSSEVFAEVVKEKIQGWLHSE